MSRRTRDNQSRGARSGWKLDAADEAPPTRERTASGVTMRRLFSVGYFGSWLVAAAMLSYALTALLWGIADVSTLTGVDDDVALLALPIGAVLGAWGAVRARYAAVLHRAFSLAEYRSLRWGL